MKQIRSRLSYANVMSTIAVFLVLGGATAFAASQLGKNTVGARQLKKNAVTTAKIKKEAVNGSKLKKGAVGAANLAAGAVGSAAIADGAVSGSELADGSVSTGKIADGAITGAKINAGSAPFTQRVAQVRGNASIPFSPGQLYPLANPNYTQPAGETDLYIGGMEVTFAATCNAPRTALAQLALDAANPLAPTPSEIIGFGYLEDKNSGQTTRQLTFGTFAGLGGGNFRAASSTPQAHTFSIFMSGSSCGSGTGVSASGATVDVIGTR